MTLREKTIFYTEQRQSTFLQEWFNQQNFNDQLKLMNENASIILNEMSIPYMIYGVENYSLNDKVKMIPEFKKQLFAWEKQQDYPFDTFDELKDSIEKNYIRNRKSEFIKLYGQLSPEGQVKFWTLLEWYFDKAVDEG
jgi:hypothetical protein